MATTVDVTTTYAGEFAGKYVAAALLSANTIEQGLITVKPNVKYKEVLKKVGVGTLIGNQACDFTPSSDVTLSERVLTVENFQVNLELCKQSFRSDYDAISMGYSAHDTLPKNFADFLIAHVAAQVAAEMETTIWQGANATAGQFDGFCTLLAADPNLPAAQEVTGTTVTASNVIAQLGAIVDAVPARLYGKDGLQIYVAQNIFKAYVRALGGFGTSGLGANGVGANGTMWYNGQGLNFDGIPVVMVNGMASNKAICTYKDNLYFGTSIMSDWNQVKVLDMENLDGSDNVRVVMKFAAGVQYSNVEDIVTYGIANSLVS